MPRSIRLRRSLAAAATLTLTTGAGAALSIPAYAAPGGQGHGQGSGQGHGQGSGQAHGQAHGQDHGPRPTPGQTKDKPQGQHGSQHGQPSSPGSSSHHPHPAHPAHPSHPAHPATPPQAGHPGSGNGNANSHGSGNPNSHGSKGNGHPTGQSGNPPGNNGTVKITPLGETDSTPDNNPHVGCAFQVEWYGYDEGPDVVSTVTFAMQAPTRDASFSMDGPASVFVGGDPATGAGTPTGLDGRETYTLSFDGEPHPKQGYHVRLTVATPHSLGNDTKTKVFWVAPCASDSGDDTPGGSGDSGTTESGTTESGTTEAGASDSGTDHGSADGNVLGTQASSADSDDTSASSTNAAVSSEDRAASADDTAQVPTAVDAGEQGASVQDVLRSPWPLAVVGLGAAVTAGALLVRRRAGR